MSQLAKCGFFALLSVALFISSFAYSFDAKAASPYDDIVETVPQVYTRCLSTGENETAWGGSLGGFALNTDKYDPSQEQLVTDARALLNKQFNRGKGWFIQQHVDWEGKPTFVTLTVYDTDEVKPKFVTDTNYGFFGADTAHLRFDGAVYNENYFSFKAVDYGHSGYACGDFQLEMTPDVNWYKDDQKFRPLFLNDTLTYPENYAGVIIKETSDTAITPAPELEKCTWYNVGCHLTNAGEVIGDTFGELPETLGGLLKGLTSLLMMIFIPSDNNIFVTAFNNLNDYMRAKLGILLYPFDFVSAIFNPLLITLDVFDKSEWHCSTITSGNHSNAICEGICAPNVLGNNSLCFKIGALEYAYPTLWQVMIWFLRIAVLGGMIEMLRKKYMDITRS